MLFMIALFALSAKSFAEENRPFSAQMNLVEILNSQPAGTPGREENEFKLAVRAPAEILNRSSYVLSVIKRALERALLNDLLWRAPKFTGSNYSILKTGLGTFSFLDIYLDSPEMINLQNNISYRVRYRWHSRSSLFKYVTQSHTMTDYPHRCEYQLKIYDEAWNEGFNSCSETRFEYRNESFPFKIDDSAPLPPWPFEKFIKPAMTGKYKNFTVFTAYDYALYLKKKLQKSFESIFLEPSLILITSRRRIHLGLPNEFGLKAAERGMGSAVNSSQAILITLDTSEIYSVEFLELYRYAVYASARNSLTPRLVKRLRSALKPVDSFTEIEFEFERNIQAALDYELENCVDESEKPRLIATKAAFLHDLKKVAEIVAEALARIDVKTEYGTGSKYQRAFNLLKSSSLYKQ
jgi:hypothetical protein